MEFERYWNLATKGQLYEHLMDKTGLSRAAVKVGLLRDVFGKRGPKQIVVASKVLTLCYPHDQKTRTRPRDSRYFAARSANIGLTWFQLDPKKQINIFTATELTGVRAYGKWLHAGPKKDMIQGRPLWHRTLGERINALLAVRSESFAPGVVLVGTKLGNIYALRITNGSIAAFARLNGAPIRGFVLDKGTGTILAPASDGTVLRISLRKEP